MSINRNDNRVENTKRNGIFGILSKLVTLIVLFLVRTVIIVYLGIEYTGVSSLFGSIIQVLSVSELGLSSAVLFSLYKPAAEGDVEMVSEQLAILRNFYKIVGVVIFSVGILLTPFLNKFVKGTPPNNINIYIIYIAYVINSSFSYLLFGYKSILLDVYQRNDIICKIKILTDIFKGVFQIAFIVCFKNFYLYILVEILATVLQNILILVTVNKNFSDINFHKKVKKENVAKISKQIKGAAIGRMSLVCRNSFDSIIISAMIGLTANGIYSNYYYVFTSVFAFLNIIVVAMSGSVGNSLAKESISKNEKDHLKFDFFYMALSSIITMCLLGLYQPFMSVWVGEAYCFPYSSMALFCLYFYTNSLAQIRAIYSEAAGMWWQFRYITIAEMIANLLLNFVLGRYFGVNGILIATIITSVLSSFVFISAIVYRDLFNTSAMRYYLNNLIYFFVTFVGCLFVYKTSEFFISKSIGELILKTILLGLCTSVYIVSVYYCIPFTRQFIKVGLNMIINKKGENI